MVVSGALLRSRVASVPFLEHGMRSSRLCGLCLATVRCVTLRSFDSSAATSLFCVKNARRYVSVPCYWSSWPVTVQRLQHRSTAAAPDVFPKRITRRTKKKETENRSQVEGIVLSSSLIMFTERSGYATEFRGRSFRHTAMPRISIGLDYGYGTVEKLTLSGADRRINMSLMKISYSLGARN